ncbi:hypothetical protein FNO01nite_16290 [Flavobacterium noncentrifugens]|uniref:Predicted oxidoreductase, contains short-chain dehydrogenase (SDR) and DUF2520 domains n=1 Tax=Flavobacterium noncentrifugens TaxID=1128970 RepID=A0A1G8WK21_9FLAO|nr:Rossmann-like and DUF2520 domain-containing protein [Flavobacterium noncentrifugens]GEP50957.1 hypothetical protein FNO01nite_16290 [Flavobacterium noncentrifugens]SDJ78466.1 Predicted oxidoreductase, contains short-chain dehydrogenase (SDR) and DUF2520 domains [Flavobacterium noncentrifugens]
MIKIAIIGSGNVAQHLISAFTESDRTEVVQVFSRSNFESDTIPVVHNLNELAAADLYIIAVSDDAIAEVSSQLPFENRLVAHTSGSVSIDALNAKNSKAVFYPLQTFSKNKATDFKVIPICIETESGSDFDLVQKTAKSISEKVFSISSEQRKSIHVSAVFVNNFVNHLYKIGNDICNEHGLPFEILQPLIRETSEKIMTLSPKDAQTGPAKRNDLQTINAHLDFLSDENQRNIYKILTQSIQNGKNL